MEVTSTKKMLSTTFIIPLISDGLSHMNFISVSQQYIKLLD